MTELTAKNVAQCLTENGVRLYSLSEIRNGRQETHYYTPSSLCHNSYSVAKLFTTTAIGMLCDEGKLATDTKIYDLLQDSFPTEHDIRWHDVTVHHLLTHSFGIDKGYLDIDVEDVNTYGTKDYLRYAFSRNLPLSMGQKRVYSDAAFYILSRAAAKAAGMEMAAYLRDKLFNPLDFHEVAWSMCPMGYAMGATGLYIRSEDMAKLGQVYLEGGTYGGKRIVSEEWTRAAFERCYEWYPCRREGAFHKGGMLGQMLYISQKDNLVLAWHAYEDTGATSKVMELLHM